MLDLTAEAAHPGLSDENATLLTDPRGDHVLRLPSSSEAAEGCCTKYCLLPASSEIQMLSSRTKPLEIHSGPQLANDACCPTSLRSVLFHSQLATGSACTPWYKNQIDIIPETADAVTIELLKTLR
jgi:hypothetical protein